MSAALSAVQIDTDARRVELQALPAAPLLELRGVGKSWAGREVLRGIDLQIHEGEFVAIVGFSGSGKSTLISLIAGLIRPDAGELLKAGQPIMGPGPDRGVVFQGYSLMPCMTVTENVALAVNRVHARLPATERRALVAKYIDLVNLTPAAHQHPAELSGGMRQRVAVARALAMEPDILLLDEPLSALDVMTREKLQDEIIRIWSADRRTVVLITNDVDEAIMLADRIIPLNPGPGATFGPEFVNTLSRPRDRKSVNHDEAFKQLRRRITEYLIGMQSKDIAAAVGDAALPAVKPVTAASMQPPGAAHGGGISEQEAARYVEFSNVTKIYPGRRGPVRVVDGFNLKIRRGEFISVIGHSGCGKSTVLSMIAGLSGISEGVIVLDYRQVRDPGPDRAVVFQSPSLVPWLTASENVALGVDRVYPHASAADRTRITGYYLARVGLADAADRRAGELSAGMKQRVGIARAFALQPKLLLLDEPFGMLDSLTRWELQEVLMEVWARTQLTAVIVTHDVDEAILLADRVVMMTSGPNARVGRIMPVTLPRPRTRRQLLDHPDYYRLRENLIEFLAKHDHGGARQP